MLACRKQVDPAVRSPYTVHILFFMLDSHPWHCPEDGNSVDIIFSTPWKINGWNLKITQLKRIII